MVLKRFYPKPLLQTCGDADILVKEEKIEDAGSLLVKACGYKVESYNFHDVVLLTMEEQTVDIYFSELYDIENLDDVLSHIWD